MSIKIKNVVIIGAGIMGSGIATLTAGAGIQTKLLDILPQSLTDAEIAKGLTLEDKAVRNRFANAGKNRVIASGEMFAKDLDYLIATGNIVDDIECIKEADWVIEAIIETLEAKQELLAKIAPYTKANCIITTNTSGVSINEISKALSTEKKGYFLGTHFFNPPRHMNLLELIPSADTLPEVFDYIKDFSVRRLGKTALQAWDTPNFIANRIGNANSLFSLNLSKIYNLNFAQVDALQGSLIGRSKMGVFGVLDLVGIDTYAMVTEAVRKACKNEQVRKYLDLPDYVVKMLKNGQHGNKTKKGFYQRVKTPQKTTLMWDTNKEEYVPKPDITVPGLSELSPGAGMKEKVWAIINTGTDEGMYFWEYFKYFFSYTAELTAEITDDFRKIDVAMTKGYGWELGPYQLWDALGAKEVVDRMVSDGQKVADWVISHLNKNNGHFYDEHGFGELVYHPSVNLSKNLNSVFKNDVVSFTDIGDGIGCIEIVSKNSVLNISTRESIAKAVETAPQHFNGLVLANSQKNFCVGADLKAQSENIQNKRFENISNNIDQFHYLSMLLKYSPLPVVAAIQGNVLGGGLEICMHTHKIVAFKESFLGLVEPRVGLIPSGGGLAEQTVRVMENWMEYSDLEVFPMLYTCYERIASALVSGSAHEARSMGYIGKNDRIIMNLDLLLDTAKEEALYLSNSFIPLAKRMFPVLGESAYAAIVAKNYNKVMGGWISAYDAFIMDKIAYVMCGGNLPAGTLVDESYLLKLEKEKYLELLQEKRTFDRITAMLETGKPLKN